MAKIQFGAKKWKWKEKKKLWKKAKKKINGKTRWIPQERREAKGPCVEELEKCGDLWNEGKRKEKKKSLKKKKEKEKLK